MSTPARRRLLRDLKRVMLDPPAGILAHPDKDDIMQWQAVIFGPDDTPWEGGTFKLSMKFPEEYPNKPPVVKFVTKLFHPNIYTDGAICLDILANQWSPIYDVAAILASIQSLLTDPNPNSPANVEAAKLYVENRREYDRKVAEVIEALWKLENPEDDEDEEEEEDEEGESADAAPRKKQKLTETTALNSNAAATPSATTTSTPAAATSSTSSSSAAAVPPSQAAASAAAAQNQQ